MQDIVKYFFSEKKNSSRIFNQGACNRLRMSILKNQMLVRNSSQILNQLGVSLRSFDYLVCVCQFEKNLSFYLVYHSRVKGTLPLEIQVTIF